MQTDGPATALPVYRDTAELIAAVKRCLPVLEGIDALFGGTVGDRGGFTSDDFTMACCAWLVTKGTVKGKPPNMAVFGEVLGACFVLKDAIEARK